MPANRNKRLLCSRVAELLLLLSRRFRFRTFLKRMPSLPACSPLVAQITYLKTKIILKFKNVKAVIGRNFTNVSLVSLYAL